MDGGFWRPTSMEEKMSYVHYRTSLEQKQALMSNENERWGDTVVRAAAGTENNITTKYVLKAFQ